MVSDSLLPETGVDKTRDVPHDSVHVLSCTRHVCHIVVQLQLSLPDRIEIRIHINASIYCDLGRTHVTLNPPTVLNDLFP